ncbi:integral membrane protein GPR180 [Periplaneta americana]|uniref:integral membrane protein GPR180 n=1 Tax=Periplaneta americana TaxID=6978 RepID=UPI0037E72726
MASRKQMEAMCVSKYVSFLRVSVYIFYLFVLLSLPIQHVDSSHITGTWNTKEFFKFLIKFGFKKTDVHNSKDTSGYIFGNITAKTNFTHNVTFAVLDRGYFLEYYGNRTIVNKEKACTQMFNKISTIAYDFRCYDQGEDFLRKVPCPKGSVCVDEDAPWNVVKGHQFTFVIEDLMQPRFWYISLVACYRNLTTCKWHHVNEEAVLEYDIWLVNGNPNVSSFNPLVYQFSFDRQDTVELYLVFFLCYLVLVPLQVYAAMRQHHPVTRLFTASLILEFLALCLILLHVLKFSLDGTGIHQLAVAGDILDILSRTTFMLLLLLLAKGWAVTRLELTWKPLVFAIWFLYGVVHILLYVWNMTEVDIIEDIDEYQTWPGWLIIVFRTLIMVWFLFELRNTMMYEHNTQKLNFFLHFGASALVWFIYLPIIALIALQVSALWRFKLLLGITYSADCLAYCVMTHLLWPTRSEQYFLLAEDMDLSDELDEFNEAPHVINNYIALNSHHHHRLHHHHSVNSEPPDLTKVIT